MTKQAQSRFVVRHVYTWILPLLTTLALLFGGDHASHPVIGALLWTLLLVAYFSMPWNYQGPNQRNFDELVRNLRLYAVIVPLQMIALGGGVFVLTFGLCSWYVPRLSHLSTEIAVANGLLYSVTIGLESERLRKALKG